MIRLNVGGTNFVTTKTTLENSGYFRALLSGQWKEEEEIFIDRDPDNFKHVLAHLRDPNHNIPWEIIYEIDYFQIDYFVGNKTKEAWLELLADDIPNPYFLVEKGDLIDLLIKIERLEGVNRTEGLFEHCERGDLFEIRTFLDAIEEKKRKLDIINSGI